MKPFDEKPSQEDFGKLRAFLRGKNVPKEQIDAFLPVGAHTKMTRREMTDKVQALIKNLPERTP